MSDPEILIRLPETGRTDVLCTIPVGYSRTLTITAPDATHFTARLGDSSPLPKPPTPVEDRISLILDVLRANNLHQDHCQELGVDRANAHGGAYYLPKPCNCWLAHADPKDPR